MSSTNTRRNRIVTRYLVRVTVTYCYYLLDTKEFLEPVTHVVNTEAERVMEVSSKQEKLIKRFAWAAEKGVCARSPS